MRQTRIFRDILIRKLVGVPVAAVAVAVSGLMLAASPASAASNVHLTEVFGAYRVGAPNIGLDDPVTETIDGRDLNIFSSGSGVEIQFRADTSLCVAAANDGIRVVQHPCNGGLGTIWHEQNGTNCPQGTCFESNEFSGFYLSGANNGSNFEIHLRGAPGWEQQFIVG